MCDVEKNSVHHSLPKKYSWANVWALVGHCPLCLDSNTGNRSSIFLLSDSISFWVSELAFDGQPTNFILPIPHLLAPGNVNFCLLT